MSVLVLHAASSIFLAGLIWFVQIVHYPLFRRVGEGAFPQYHRDHTRRTTWVVLPPMILELVTGVMLVVASVPGGRALPLVGLGLIGLIWLSTFLIQVPGHQVLAEGYQEGPAHRLVRTNWIRTAAWTARVPLVLHLLSRS